MGTFPSIIILFTIVFLFGLKEKLILVIALILIPFTPHQIPIQNVAKSNFKTALSILKNPEFFENFSLDKDYFYSQKEIEDMSRFIKKHPGKIMIFPYDNYLLNIAGETFNTYPEQFNVYTNSSVEKEAVKRLEKEPPKYIIFGPDDIGALRIDGMPNFTRNPLIAKWIIENYAVSETKRNYLILEYKKNKTKTVGNVCNLFNIKTEIKDSNTIHILATFLKPPIYTMTINENTFRIPFKRNIDQYLIFTGKNISDYVNLFNSKIDFKKPKAIQKNFKIEINKNVDIINQNINFDQQKSGIQIECYN